MQTKLTLRLEEKLIAKAKARARVEGKSLSQMVAEYFAVVSSKSHMSASDVSAKKRLRPVTTKLYGCMQDARLDKADYGDYLDKKYQ